MPYRGAIIGLGNIALKGHAPAYLKYQDEFEIVAGVDKCAQNHEIFRRFFPQAVTYYDLQDLFDHQELDFVDICTPPAYHASIICEAAHRKIHVLCEKPVAVNQADMEIITQAVSSANIVFIPCHQYYFSPQWQAVQRLIAEEQIGCPRRFEVKVSRCQPNQGNPYWQPSWRTIKHISGGGILIDHGTHQFYLAMRLLGTPLNICARLETLNKQYNGVEDTVHITMEHEHGISQFDLTWDASDRQTKQHIKGELGQIIITEEAIDLQTGSNSQIINFEQGLSSNSSHADWYEILFRDFMEQIKQAYYDPRFLAEAQHTLKCTILAYESARLGQTVDF